MTCLTDEKLKINFLSDLMPAMDFQEILDTARKKQ